MTSPPLLASASFSITIASFSIAAAASDSELSTLFPPMMAESASSVFPFSISKTSVVLSTAIGSNGGTGSSSLSSTAFFSDASSSAFPTFFFSLVLTSTSTSSPSTAPLSFSFTISASLVIPSPFSALVGAAPPSPASDLEGAAPSAEFSSTVAVVSFDSPLTLAPSPSPAGTCKNGAVLRNEPAGGYTNPGMVLFAKLFPYGLYGPGTVPVTVTAAAADGFVCCVYVGPGTVPGTGVGKPWGVTIVPCLLTMS
mmetsp:Transcript_29627/g.45270  ORF Transcript_29627/g.45270 Transcript_29627/m.45270 type:complete len:254 (+) Transcript_29627:306-1067(+)